VSAFGYNDQAGTIVVEAVLANHGNSGSSSEGIASLIANGGVENIGLYKLGEVNSNKVFFDVRSSNTSQATFTVEAASGEVKIAYGFAENDFNISVDGALETKDTSGSVPTGVSSLVLGYIYYIGGGFPLNGHIKSVQYYPRRLTDDQLVELTS
jgi:hypothetical protein